MSLVDVTRLALALNISERRVQQLVTEEGMPREKRGRYDAIKCIRWYIRYLQALLDNTPLPTTGEREQRLRLLRVQADLKEMELSKQRSQFVAIQDVDSTLNELVRETTARIMAIPPQIAPELVGETSRVMIHAKIDKAVKRTLSDLAKLRLDAGGLR